MRRVADEPAFVLHRYDWSESSLILELFTRRFGRVAAVAKGAKRPSSNFRPVLLPLQPLHVAFSGDAEIRTLKSAEWLGGQAMPAGEALLVGYHLNELLLRLLARDDAHPALFDAYAATVSVVAARAPEVVEAALRAFELLLLREIGLLPSLALQTGTLAPLVEDQAYALKPEAGLLEVGSDEPRGSLPGRQWLALQHALDQEASYAALLRVTAAAPDLKPQLRALLHYHCGVTSLRTRQMMLDLQSL